MEENGNEDENGGRCKLGFAVEEMKWNELNADTDARSIIKHIR